MATRTSKPKSPPIEELMKLMKEYRIDQITLGDLQLMKSKHEAPKLDKQQSLQQEPLSSEEIWLEFQKTK